ncbi:FAD-binding domain-containing protein 33 [Elsinoe australis]|uniref:FAD-binding domain-containing protein 33 n=1 Tax=Elsinoe australis TaxID=40998 RepID=A0A4V6DTT7_9PEZI|nr:FAD-binding domain-containing protein 33 [Elsinoe australis]
MNGTKNSPIPPPDEVRVEHGQVIVVGAGPVGLFLALKMVQAGINVLILEAEKGIVQSPRATTQKVGVYQDLEEAGFKNKEGIAFRESYAKGGEILAQLKMSLVPEGAVKFDFAGIHLGQHALATILLSHCQRYSNFKILWGHRFVGVQQSDENEPVTVTAVGQLGEKFFTCDHLVGADGAGSAVRRALCIPFEGFTWQDFRFVASNVKYDFDGLGGFTTANMIVDEEDWAVIARTGPGDAPWRVALGVRTDVPESEILKQLPGKYERLFPGPRPLKYELVSANPYWAHQRVASKFKVGKVVLCGDAAHSNNPIGGLGLTTGLMDAAALGNCFTRIYKYKEPADRLLERYAEVRKEAWVKYTNPGSIDFKLRVHSEHPDAVASRKGFFDALNNDPDIHMKMATMMNEVIQDEFSSPE